MNHRNVVLSLIAFVLAAAVPASAITVDDTISFTTSPFNEIVRPSPYTFSASPDLDGFDPSGSDKLIFAFASENGISVTSITFGGVPMSPAVAANNGAQLAGIYYLDNPPAIGGLVVQFSGSSVNGVGGSLIAVSDVETGFATTNSSTTQTVSLTTTASGSLVVAAHANNDSNGSIKPNFTALLDGPVGSAGGGTGYLIVASPSAVTPNFTGSTSRPVTAVVEFLSGNGSSANTFTASMTSGATGYDFSWPSQNEKLYDLVSATDLSTSPDQWEVYNDGTSTYSDLVATPPDNTLNSVAVMGNRRFFVVIEKDPPVPVVDTIRVFLVAGQSNADGRADPADLPTTPVNLKLPQGDIDFYYKVQGQASALTTLQPGLSETSGFGPSITFGRAMSDALGNGTTTRVALIKYANGGTNLQNQWTSGGDATTSGDGAEYVTFQDTVANGMAVLAAAYPAASINIEGMIWSQGETDIDLGYANNYQTNLTNFIADVRATLGTNLPFIVIRLSDGQTALNATGLTTVRTAQVNVATADLFTDWVDTDGFGIKTDNLHFDATGQHSIGTAAASSLLTLLP